MTHILQAGNHCFLDNISALKEGVTFRVEGAGCQRSTHLTSWKEAYICHCCDIDKCL